LNPNQKKLANNLLRFGAKPLFALCAVYFDLTVLALAEGDLIALALDEEFEALLDAWVSENAVK
jgi:hypothetical protein